ncbi:hypothetical protein BGZ61DRAFT_481999 [Ilyonectria robusta]|uniref:uncharacterized protein n=1 Tax=Ilyonectria robusta TaxID=1079257 RepID=UPI001E8CBB00|nr:uncharacterized protein BGZ61DRAFT_481999 [Ilyonectria robusta]KAH8675036.1 hypothetical protein BGZ61DRAFT_481999 [Ilyonectria robusta]
MASTSSKIEKREPLEKVTLLGSNKAKDTVASQGVTLSRHHRYIFNGLATSLCLGVGTLLSMAASESLAGLVVIPLHIINLILLERRGKPLPVILNMIYFGVSAFLACFTSLGYSLGAIFFQPRRCDQVDPYFSDVPPWSAAQVEECDEWVVKYQASICIFVVLLALYGIVQMALFIAVVVDVFDNTQNGTSEGSGTLWSLPVGRFSVELSFNCGPPKTNAPQQQSKTVEITQSSGRFTTLNWALQWRIWFGKTMAGRNSLYKNQERQILALKRNCIQKSSQ